MMLNFVLRGSRANPVGPADSDQAARIFTPGPIRSGFKICGVTVFGPLELKAATTGDGRTSKTVPRKLRRAVGFLVDRTYSLMRSPIRWPTANAGSK